MQPTEFTLDPKVTAALEAAFMPYAAQQVQGMPLGKALREMSVMDLPRPLQLALAQKLEQVLLLEGGREGAALLEALDGTVSGAAYPAVVVHGLPHDSPGLMGVVSEAFRLRMGHDFAHHTAHEVLLDAPVSKTPEGFQKSGHTALHQDRHDLVMIYGIRTGGNPRGTVLLDAGDLVRYVTDLACKEPPYHRCSPAERAQLEKQFNRMLQQPIWPLSSSQVLGDEMVREAKQANALHTEGQQHYGPILYPNPDYHAGQPGSCSHRILRAPFMHAQDRSRIVDETGVPPEDRQVLEALVKALRQATRRSYPDAPAKPLAEGDLLVFNNSLLMHAGGPHMYKSVKPGQQGRLIGALDVVLDDGVQARAKASLRTSAAIVADGPKTLSDRTGPAGSPASHNR